MSLTKEAVQHIQESANIPAIIESLKQASTDIPMVAIPETFSLKSLESQMEHASRYRMNYSTTSIGDFIAYNEDFDQLGATCFVDAERMRAKSIHDLGTLEAPGHKEHSSSLTLTKSAAFTALLNVDDSKLSQKAAAEFIEDWADSIEIYNQESEQMTSQLAAKAIRDLSIEAAREVNSKVGDFSESMTAMERVEAKNQNSLPSSIWFSCTPYQGLSDRSFQIKLSIITSSEKPLISFRIVRLEAEREAIAEEFKELLESAFDTCELKVFIGQA